MYNNNDTMAIDVTLKKWGNSLGVIFPKELVRQKNLKVNEKVTVEIVKKADLIPIFGSLKRKMSGQEFKNFIKKGWK